MKTGDDVQVVDQDIVDEVENDDNNNTDDCNFDDNSDNRNYDKDHEIQENNSNTESDPDDEDSKSNVVEADLVTGFKKRGKRSKKTTDSNLVCNSDNQFLQMHGSGEFPSLPCNNFSNKELLKRLENRAHNTRSKKLNALLMLYNVNTL